MAAAAALAARPRVVVFDVETTDAVAGDPGTQVIEIGAVEVLGATRRKPAGVNPQVNP